VAKKSLGQHWLKDKAVVKTMAEVANLDSNDTVIEVGSGHGVLTAKLVKKARHVVSVEIDEELASSLREKIGNPENLTVEHADFLEFDLSKFDSYKIVANIPYFITGKIIRKLIDAPNQPSRIVILVQKEVAERLAARDGKHSIISILSGHFYDIELSSVVPAESFEPSPKVDSQIVVMSKKDSLDTVDFNALKYLVRSGFSARRKKLLNNLSAGLQIDKTEVKIWLEKAEVGENARAQELSLEQWYRLISTR